MNTPVHLICGGGAAFGQPAVTAAALLSGLAPGPPPLMVAWSRLVGDVPARTIFREYNIRTRGWLFSPSITPPDLGGAADTGIKAAWRHGPVVVTFAGPRLLHLAFDLPLHGADARPMFWPQSHCVLTGR